MDKLLNYQIPHFHQLHESTKVNKCTIDVSDTGTGKTYTAMALCKILGLKPFVICPKSVIYNWQQVADFFNMELFGVSNYEYIKNGKYYTKNLIKCPCPYFDILATEQKYRWALPDNVILIFDEVHRCKNKKTHNSKLFAASYLIPNKILLLSATLADKPAFFSTFGYVLGFYESPKMFKKWIKQRMGSVKEKNPMIVLNNILFPAYGSRMRIKELGNLFPKNQVVAQCYFMKNHEKIDQLYEEINQIMANLKKEENDSCMLVKLLRARQRIELLKVPTFLDLAFDYILHP
jgi:hypothetical protein